ncbi:ExbD/TolR family protein [Luteimonas sp. BDR2-5]|uniref:ExbD/TolR family protein n=1 Tax=Proluteimonas luteida TaxID=2878685 RepID=UPI001E370DB0|nr:ExbD/TolR family protein [Luteimonas sp. BDR2-5]MCD9027439.1 ExbD/TolR family protein [Luteimonas sp. BDR2-5]
MSSMSLRRAKRRKLKNEINVVPYIDVMLVLLIIFMVTTPLMNLGTDINLPDSRALSLGAPKDPIVVSVYADGALALMIERDNQSVGAQDLVARLRAIHNQNPEAAVLVRGDADASYQRIMNAISLINDAGVTRVSLISRPEEGAN